MKKKISRILLVFFNVTSYLRKILREAWRRRLVKLEINVTKLKNEGGRKA